LIGTSLPVIGTFLKEFDAIEEERITVCLALTAPTGFQKMELFKTTKAAADAPFRTTQLPRESNLPGPALTLVRGGITGQFLCEPIVDFAKFLPANLFANRREPIA
jgi:hypothetical protein